MPRAIDVFRSKLRAKLATYGDVAEFCRSKKLNRSMVDRWLKGRGGPSITGIDRIAAALDSTPWELLRPPGAQPTPPPREHTLADCKRAVDAALERQLAADAETRGKADMGRAGAEKPEREDGDGPEDGK